MGRFVLGTLRLGTFCLGTFCHLERFVLGRFFCATSWPGWFIRSTRGHDGLSVALVAMMVYQQHYWKGWFISSAPILWFISSTSGHDGLPAALLARMVSALPAMMVISSSPGHDGLSAALLAIMVYQQLSWPGWFISRTPGTGGVVL